MTTVTETLEDQIKDTLAWAAEVSEQWTGTLYEAIIEHEKKQLVTAYLANDEAGAKDRLWKLGETLHDASTSYEGL